jgi:hypothetical protein
MKHMQADMSTLISKVDELNQSLARYRGAWGAVVMIGGALVAAVTLGFKYFGK